MLRESECVPGPSSKQRYIFEVFANWIGQRILGINFSLSKLSFFHRLLALNVAKENPEVSFIFLPLALAFPPYTPPPRIDACREKKFKPLQFKLLN